MSLRGPALHSDLGEVVLQVSYAITASARQAVGEGEASKASPRKRPRTDNGGTEAADTTGAAPKLFVEQPSPIALAKAIKNKVCISKLRLRICADGTGQSPTARGLHSQIGL